MHIVVDYTYRITYVVNITYTIEQSYFSTFLNIKIIYLTYYLYMKVATMT